MLLTDCAGRRHGQRGFKSLRIWLCNDKIIFRTYSLRNPGHTYEVSLTHCQAFMKSNQHQQETRRKSDWSFLFCANQRCYVLIARWASLLPLCQTAYMALLLANSLLLLLIDYVDVVLRGCGSCSEERDEWVHAINGARAASTHLAPADIEGSQHGAMRIHSNVSEVFSLCMCAPYPAYGNSMLSAREGNCSSEVAF
jgi:hypothetical protein